MIYLLRVVNRSIQIAACEDENRVPALLAQGYRVVTRAQYIAAWRKRDWLDAKSKAASVRSQPQERAVGDAPVLPTLPGRWKVFKVE